MKNIRFPTLALAASMALGAVLPASALPMSSAAPATPQRILLVQGDDRGGQQVCVIVVLGPGQDGQRPRRAEFVVPM
jgi:hypothetical protein